MPLFDDFKNPDGRKYVNELRQVSTPGLTNPGNKSSNPETKQPSVTLTDPDEIRTPNLLISSQAPHSQGTFKSQLANRAMLGL